jgi:hypothetical protein
VATEDGTSREIPGPGQPVIVSRYAAVHAKLDGRWMVASVRDLDPEPQAVPIAERLKPLDFLIGDWVDEGNDGVVASNYRWGKDKTSIEQDFVIKRGGVELLKGTQRIGWDPQEQTIKSWMFDSQGGSGQGVWTWTGDRWVIKMTGVRSDGKHASATNSLIPLSKHSFRWQSRDRIVGDEIAPDQQVTVVRKAPLPRDAAANVPGRRTRPANPASGDQP